MVATEHLEKPVYISESINKSKVWSCFCSHDTTGISVGKNMYWKILEKNLLPSTKVMRMRRQWTFLQDDEPKRTAKECELRLAPSEENKGVDTAILKAHGKCVE